MWMIDVWEMLLRGGAPTLPLIFYRLQPTQHPGEVRESRRTTGKQHAIWNAAR